MSTYSTPPYSRMSSFNSRMNSSSITLINSHLVMASYMAPFRNDFMKSVIIAGVGLAVYIVYSR